MTGEAFREKLGRELRSGVVTLLTLHVVDRWSAETYGYDIIQRIRELTGDRLAFKEGTVYPILKSLEDQGLIASFWGSEGSGPRRKYYRITSDGRGALALATAHWQEMKTVVDDVLGTTEKGVRQAARRS